MAHRPLQYDSKKAVLKYIEPNLRFMLACRLPSLKIMKKVVPLKISRLSFHDYQLVINNATYEIGIYVDYHEKPTPTHFRRDNENGGAKADIDRYGFKDHTEKNSLLPGNINLQLDFMHRDDIGSAEDKLKLFYTNLVAKSEEERKYVRIMQQIFENRRNGVHAPQTLYIQLTKRTPKSTTFERVQYNKKLHEAENYFYSKLFGGRRHSVNVDQFSVEVNRILRVPTELKVSPKIFSPDLEHLTPLWPIINATHLDVLNVSMRGVTRFPYETIKNVPKVIISLRDEAYGDELRFLSQNLQNHVVVLKTADVFLFSGDYLKLIQSVIENGKPVEYFFEHPADEEDVIVSFIQDVIYKYDLIDLKAKFLKLPMKNGHVLDVSFRSTEQLNQILPVTSRCKWFIRLKVLHA